MTIERVEKARRREGQPLTVDGFKVQGACQAIGNRVKFILDSASSSPNPLAPALYP